MTNADYLEQYATIANVALPQIALMMARQDYDNAASTLSALQNKLSDLWTQYMAEASATVAP